MARPQPFRRQVTQRTAKHRLKVTLSPSMAEWYPADQVAIQAGTARYRDFACFFLTWALSSFKGRCPSHIFILGCRPDVFTMESVAVPS